MAAAKDAVSFRCDSQLKSATLKTLDEMQVSLSDVLRDTMHYIVENKRLPVSRQIVSEEDAELLRTVRERLSKPRSSRVRMTFDELVARHNG